MASVFARRAEEFAALVEGASTSGQHRHADLLAVVGQLRAANAPSPRPEFVSDLRARLLAEADTVLVPTAAGGGGATGARLLPRDPPRRTSRERRTAWGVGSLALLTSAATVVVGSQVALPGDALYPVKRAIEDVNASLAVGDGETGERMLAHATERLDETRGLTRRAEVDAAATESVLRDFVVQASDGALLVTEAYADSGEESRIADLRDFTGDSMERLAAVEPALPDEARDELVAAAATVVSIDDDAQNACPQCGGEGVVDVPINLLSVDLPALLDAAPDSPGVLGAPGSDGGERENRDGNGAGPSGPPTSLLTDAATGAPTGGATDGPSGGATDGPSGGAGPTDPPPSSAKAPVPTVLPTLLPTAVPTVLPTQITTLLTPLDPVTSLLTPLDPGTSLLPSLPLGLVARDDLHSPSPHPLP